MILCIDIGNTNIKAAVFEHTKECSHPLHVWRLKSDILRTSDEYTSVLSSMVSAYCPLASITASAISSVVPALTAVFCTVARNITGEEAFVISAQMPLPVKVSEEAKHEIGSDLLCDAAEAYSRSLSPCIVCDAGTAFSFVAVGTDGTIAGVAIAPGINTALSALVGGTAQLTSVPLLPPKSSLGQNTTEALQSGVLLGYTHLVKGLLRQMKEELSSTGMASSAPCKTYATGGLILPMERLFDEVDKDITLCGVYRLWLASLSNHGW